MSDLSEPLSPLPITAETAGPFAGIHTITLENPGKPVVVLDETLIRRLELALRDVPAHTRGLVLASASDRVFVAGADLKAIMDLSDDALDRYLSFGSRVFGMIADLPCPTAAAINGAALGGGLEVAMHCDALIGAPPAPKDGQPGRPYPVGLPEAGLGICPGWGGTVLLPARIDPQEAIRRTAAGKPMMFDEASQAGLFEAIAPTAADLLTTAKSWLVKAADAKVHRDAAPLRWAGRGSRQAQTVLAADAVRDELQPSPTGRAVLDCVDQGLLNGWQAALAAERRNLIRLRNTPEAKDAIAQFFAKSAKK